MISSTPQTSNFRSMIAAISPTWLNGSVGGRYMYTMGLVFDGLADGASYAIRCRFPDFAPTDALQWLAADRQIDRGLHESEANYATRLRQWLDLWRYAGNTWSVLRALDSAITPDFTALRAVSNTSVWHWYNETDDVNSPPAYIRASPANWDWDSKNWDGLGSAGWFRLWVIIAPTSSLAQQTPKWGDGGVWGSSRSWGWNQTDTGLRDLLRAQVAKWKAAHCYIPWIIVTFDSTYFDPSLPVGSGKLPNGTWGHWSIDVGGTRVASRYSGAIYLDGAA